MAFGTGAPLHFSATPRAVSSGRPRGGGTVDGVRGFFTGEDGDDVGRGHLRHARARGVAGAADVGGDDDVGEAVEGVVEGERLGDGHVEGGAADNARLQRLDERVLIDYAAARGVHEDGGVLHGGELGGADEPFGLGAVRNVQRDEVGAFQQLREGDPFEVERALELGAGGAGGGEDGHAEAARAPRDGASDLAEADDAEGRAEWVVTQKGRGGPRSPAASAGIAVAEDDVAGGGEEEGEGEVGGGFVEYAGGVGRPDAGGGCRGGIDVVVAHGHVRDDAQAWGGGEQGRVDGVGDKGQGGVSLAEAFAEGVGRGREVIGPHLDGMPRFPEKRDGAPWHASGNEDVAHGGGLYVARSAMRLGAGRGGTMKARRSMTAPHRGAARRERSMGTREIEALIDILTRENARGRESLALGSWTISFDKEKDAFVFDKCENTGYCEERPSVIATGGEVLDPGGPLFS